mmetsp:Transcript_17506/g.27983  ORF Transcript_17506/g.27983 Transcript_17506/m.27983 type:complete len:334 (+) Transcript_17506:214-1215(+)
MSGLKKFESLLAAANVQFDKTEMKTPKRQPCCPPKESGVVRLTNCGTCRAGTNSAHSAILDYSLSKEPKALSSSPPLLNLPASSSHQDYDVDNISGEMLESHSHKGGISAAVITPDHAVTYPSRKRRLGKIFPMNESMKIQVAVVERCGERKEMEMSSSKGHRDSFLLSVTSSPQYHQTTQQHLCLEHEGDTTDSNADTLHSDNTRFSFLKRDSRLKRTTHCSSGSDSKTVSANKFEKQSASSPSLSQKVVSTHPSLEIPCNFLSTKSKQEATQDDATYYRVIVVKRKYAKGERLRRRKRKKTASTHEVMRGERQLAKINHSSVAVSSDRFHT